MNNKMIGLNAANGSGVPILNEPLIRYRSNLSIQQHIRIAHINILKCSKIIPKQKIYSLNLSFSKTYTPCTNVVGFPFLIQYTF